MIYLLDENVFINSSRDIYAPERFPEVWKWLDHWVDAGRIRTLERITTKLKQKPTKNKPEDDLSLRIRVLERRLWIDDPDEGKVRRVLRDGYGVISIEDLARGDPNDAFLIAAALVAPGDRVVVTMEDPHRRARSGPKRRIPHVCGLLGVRCVTPWKLLRALDFRTSDWRTP